MRWLSGSFVVVFAAAWGLIGCGAQPAGVESGDKAPVEGGMGGFGSSALSKGKGKGLIGEDGKQVTPTQPGSLIGEDGKQVTPTQPGSLIGEDGKQLAPKQPGALIGEDGKQLAPQQPGALIGEDGKQLAPPKP
ncbi:hypothetical protein PPSIR1_08856 [Plesiocystis pacifica SIR-1]|uniref:Lipoprotein n=1 Tax=Plesiocystis pacifica SIR-1 TaxID=391625 RepID=A6G700_9BACT|nr:hypothetical protein [Plesiocystis pacifica]EDM78276.1 hypothetical protein PPSIR1_08856 [Plesiocystis pacifica SIR-1]